MDLFLLNLRPLYIFPFLILVLNACSHTENEYNIKLDDLYTSSVNNSNIELTEKGVIFFKTRIMLYCGMNSNLTSPDFGEINSVNETIINRFYIASLNLYNKKNKLLNAFLRKSTEDEFSKLFLSMIIIFLDPKHSFIIEASLRKNGENRFIDSCYEKFIEDFLEKRESLQNTPELGSLKPEIKKELNKVSQNSTKSKKKYFSLKKFETPQKNSKLTVWGTKIESKNLSKMNSPFLHKSDSKTKINRKTIFSNKSLTLLSNTKKSFKEKDNFIKNPKDNMFYFLQTKSSPRKKTIRNDVKSISKNLDMDISRCLRKDNISERKTSKEFGEVKNLKNKKLLTESSNCDSRKKELIHFFKKKNK